MLEQIRKVDGEPLLPLPADALAAVGLQPYDQVEVTAVEQSLVVQLSPAEKSGGSEFVQTFQGVMENRCAAYRKLA